jgi:hypothetical protein
MMKLLTLLNKLESRLVAWATNRQAGAHFKACRSIIPSPQQAAASTQWSGTKSVKQDRRLFIFAGQDGFG